MVDEVLRAEGYAVAYVEVLELLDTEIAKSKDRGDLPSAELLEILRAKISARGTKLI